MLRSSADRNLNFPKNNHTQSDWTGKKQMSQITVRLHCFAKVRWREICISLFFHQRYVTSEKSPPLWRWGEWSFPHWTTRCLGQLRWIEDRMSVQASLSSLGCKTKTATKMIPRYSTLLSANTGKSMKSRQNVDPEGLWEGYVRLQTLAKLSLSNSTGALLVCKWTSFETWNGIFQGLADPFLHTASPISTCFASGFRMNWTPAARIAPKSGPTHITHRS